MTNPSFKAGVVGGTFFTLITIPWMDIEKAIIVSIVGTVTSFFVSLLVKKLTRKN